MPNIRFHNALKRIPQEIPPIWFMRQAGRYHDHYQRLKKSHTFVELCKDPILSSKTALGPIEEFDFDVAILFSDILFPLESLGMNLTYDPGPIFKENLRKDNATKIFSVSNPIASLEFQGEAIQRTLRSLDEFVLEGITTTIDLHKKILNHKKFINSDFDTNWLGKEKFY